jgi:hypothetical protein
MNTKCMIAIVLTTVSLTFGQLPKLADMKTKMSGRTTAPAAASASPAASPAPVAAEGPFTPLAAGSTKGLIDGQGMEFTMCEKGAREGQYDLACAKPARTFQYKGSVTNVFATFRFTPALTNKSTRLKVILFKKDVMDEYREVTFQPGGRTAAVSFTKAPGLYTVKVVDQYDSDRIALTDQFVVAPDSVGDRATANIKTGIGKLMVCSTIDDNWKCVNESSTWDSKKPFNLYVRLPEAISGQTAGWEIYKQNPDGTDGVFVDDLLQGTNGRAAYWATTNGNYLKPGVYTIYSISWANRATTGNLKNYFAKTTLTVH